MVFTGEIPPAQAVSPDVSATIYTTGRAAITIEPPSNRRRRDEKFVDEKSASFGDDDLRYRGDFCSSLSEIN